MSVKLIKPVTLAIGAAFAGSAVAADSDRLFVLNDLGTGYQLASAEGSCGEGKCGEGRCGLAKLDSDGDGRISRAEFEAAGKPAEKFDEIDTDGDGFISQAEFDAHHAARKEAAEGKCGEGKCGEGKCGEGKCGEGKCGGGLA